MLKLGNTDINALGNDINKAYLGTIEVFSGGNQFVSLWETITPNETITLPTPTTTYRVDWGDGTVTTNTNSHEYATAGQYTIKISGDVTDFAFNNGGDKEKILNISNFGGLSIQRDAFYGCSNLDISATDTPLLTFTAQNSFRGCASLIYNSSVNNLDASTIINNMSGVFRDAILFNQDLDSLRPLNNNTCSGMFRGATNFNGKVDGLVQGGVTIANDMFFNAVNFNQPLTDWITSSVKNFSFCFYGATNFDQDISHLDFSSVTDMSFFMAAKSIYNTTFMDNLYIKLDQDLVFANMVNVNISFGSINYTSNGAAARASLVSKGFIITSGIQV